MATREEVYKAINSERDYQNVRWGPDVTNTGHKHSILEWLAYIRDYTEEAMHIESREATPKADEKCVHFLRKIAALAVVGMEQHGAPLREMPKNE